jgi:DNA processing protein
MEQNDLLALLRLLMVPGIGPTRVRNLIGHFRHSAAVLQATTAALCRVNGIDQILAEAIRQAPPDEIAAQQISLLAAHHARIVTFWDDDFPSALKAIDDAPVALFVQGDFQQADKYCIAIVGTRQPTAYGSMVTERLTNDLVARGLAIVSGLARGVDTLAHRSALKAGGRTLAVLGSGLDMIYPPENRRLADEVSANGVVISEYFFGVKPDAVNFPRRNRIIAGLALGVLVIEAGESSGALITAAMALEQGREVFAAPGNIFSPKSIGTHRLIQEGARLVRSADDVLSELTAQLDLFGKANRTPLPASILSEAEQRLFDLLSHEPVHVDALARRANLSSAQALATLLQLEFKNTVKQLPGKMFVKM